MKEEGKKEEKKEELNKDEIEKEEKKDDKKDKGIAKGIFAGIGAALGIAAIGIGGKLIYDQVTKKKSKEENGEEKLRNEDTERIIQKLKSQKSLKPNIISDEFDKNYIRANSNLTEDEEDLINKKNTFICPISQKMMEHPVITPYGTTYEESEILKWIEQNSNDFITKKSLNKEMLVPNEILISTMKEYKESLN